MTKVKITWNNAGGELDSTTVKVKDGDDEAIARALVEMIRSSMLVEPGDSFTIESLS